MAIKRADCTILLIDNEPAGLQARELLLESVGFKVLAATTGHQSMELFRSNHVDVVVTDHPAGRWSASGIASSMKRLKPDVPIVSFSASADPEQAPGYADRCIGKEEGPEALIGALDKILAKNILAKKTRQQKLHRTARPPRTGLPTQTLLANIVEDSSDAILSKTLAGVITSWNHSAELMYGYSKEEAIGAPVAMLLPEDRPNEVAQLLRRLAQGERIRNFETVRIAKNGRKIDVSLTISPIRDRRKRIVGASTIARDISEHKHAGEAVRKAERLAVIGRMVATVAHEINNPLEAVGNILYLLRNSAELTQETRKFVELASNELERVMEITQLTLGMQRGVPKTPVSLRVTSLIENVITLYLGKTRDRGIDVVRQYSDEGRLVGFPVELQQVFSNLIVNAMDAMATTGDKLVLSVRPARRLDTGETGMRISVLDNGPGIAPEHALHVFQPFYTTKGEHGTGIGLWVSRTIVEKHGGTLRMHSSVRPGRSGTCFSIFLPRGHVTMMTKAA